MSSVKSSNRERSGKNNKKEDYESTKELIRKLEEAEMITRQRRKTGFAWMNPNYSVVWQKNELHFVSFFTSLFFYISINQLINCWPFSIKLILSWNCNIFWETSANSYVKALKRKQKRKVKNTKIKKAFELISSSSLSWFSQNLLQFSYLRVFSLHWFLHNHQLFFYQRQNLFQLISLRRGSSFWSFFRALHSLLNVINFLVADYVLGRGLVRALLILVH